MSDYCENCGSKVYNGACTNCEEEIYIADQYYDLDMELPPNDSTFYRELIQAESRRARRLRKP